MSLANPPSLSPLSSTLPSTSLRGGESSSFFRPSSAPAMRAAGLLARGCGCYPPSFLHRRCGGCGYFPSSSTGLDFFRVRVLFRYFLCCCRRTTLLRRLRCICRGRRKDTSKSIFVVQKRERNKSKKKALSEKTGNAPKKFPFFQCLKSARPFQFSRVLCFSKRK